MVIDDFMIFLTKLLSNVSWDLSSKTCEINGPFIYIFLMLLMIESLINFETEN